MKKYIRGVYHSFPVQLLFLHFRKYQVLLVFWFILFSIVNGTFMHVFGADSLFLAPEYLGNVNTVSASIVGIAIGMFIMSWNISSFILFSRNFQFLAATTNPFLKYCINNSLIPLFFLVFYFYKAFNFTHFKELMAVGDILLLAAGFIAGLVFILLASFAYFFGADRTIMRRMMPVISDPGEYITHLQPGKEKYHHKSIIRTESYFETFFRIRPCRDVQHYTPEFIDKLFKRHHFAAIISVFIAFIFLIIIGFFLDSPVFQIPAAASITILFAILIGVAGAFSYFMQSWSIVYLIIFLLGLNFFYRNHWIDPSNKAYGLNYEQREERPSYSREGLLALCTPEKKKADSLNMISILNNWKRKQDSDKPLFLILNTSGGGHRSATFTLSMLQYLDSMTNGTIMQKLFLINGASGGMIGATYFRELYLQKQKGKTINLQDKKYVDNIASDLLNPLFSSFVARDLVSPAQKFSIGNNKYIKDRGYAFEQQLNVNTGGVLNKHLKDYIKDEKAANIPLIFFNSVVTRDSRKMLISTQPVSFMMQGWQDTTIMPEMDPDVIDFASFFAKQNPYDLRVLTALRMNATFPIVLPNVWLPSNPVIDVMDAGLRDNYGQETTLRFLEAFKDWIDQNTSGVLIIQMRDRKPGGWDYPYVSDDLTDHATKPFLLLQNNWFKMMEYFQNDMLSYYSDYPGRKIHKVLFQYSADNEENKAALNFHLSRREKNSILSSVNSAVNQKGFQQLKQLFEPAVTPAE